MANGNATLAAAAAELHSLQACLVVAMPDCLLFSSWMRKDMQWAAEDAAGYFGDLIRANRRGLKAIGAWSGEMQVTIEANEALVILRELDESFACCAMFDKETPLGMVRLQLKMLLGRVGALLPKTGLEERPRGVRLIEFLERYAPDPHAVLLRVSTRTGLPVEMLRDEAHKLTEAQVAEVEQTAKKILGLEQINI
jgi:hypothetical protein